MQLNTARNMRIDAEVDQSRMLDSYGNRKGFFDSMRDRDRMLRGFEDAHERVPSSVADAEAYYLNQMREEARKHEDNSVGYLEYSDVKAGLEGEW